MLSERQKSGRYTVVKMQNMGRFFGEGVTKNEVTGDLQMVPKSTLTLDAESDPTSLPILGPPVGKKNEFNSMRALTVHPGFYTRIAATTYNVQPATAVSYTHLDVYKRQVFCVIVHASHP